MHECDTNTQTSTHEEKGLLAMMHSCNINSEKHKLESLPPSHSDSHSVRHTESGIFPNKSQNMDKNMIFIFPICPMLQLHHHHLSSALEI